MKPIEHPVLLEARCVEKHYGRHRVLVDASLDLKPGELSALIGPNGAGKSTLLRILAGLQRPSGGEVLWWDAGGQRREDPRGHVVLTPQELSLPEWLTAEEALLMVTALRGRPDAPERVRARLEHDGLLEVRGRLLRHLSGGTKRKVAVSMALLSGAPVILQDESFTGLDPHAVERLERDLRAHCDAGGSVLLVSHAMDVVERIADRLYLLHHGIVEGGEAMSAWRSGAFRDAGTLHRFYLERFR